EDFSVLRRIGIGLAIAGGVINSMLYNVDDGHRAVIFDCFQGVKLGVIEEGTHFMISWLHRPIIFDIRTRPRSILSITEIKGIKARRKQSTSGESFKICCTKSQFDAIELITQRTLISQRNSELLTERAAQFGLLLDDISIIRYDKKESRTHLSFRPEFTSAVELKQVAQQDVGKQRFLVEKTEQSRRANVIAAEGDTRAADLIGKVLDEAGDGLIELRRIEAAEGTANQLSKSRNRVYLPHGPQILLNITEIFTYRREKIDVRGECLKLVPAENIQQNTVEIIKQEINSNQNYTNARFRAPLANYLLHLVSPQVATAHFQLVLPCEHRFGSILLENPYYGLRKPPDQSRSSLLYVIDLYIMGEVLALETLMLLHWCQKMKLTSAILHGFSLGGHMASLAFTK
ncbi:unnamed protein product, partial [Rotaria sordida]